MGYVYLFHFSSPVSDRHTCRHYLGYCLDLWARVRCHAGGRGARLTEVAVERGIKLEIVRVWKGTRKDERKLKNQKNGPALCPICSANPRPVHALEELTAAEIKDLVGPVYSEVLS